ncbi:MAG: hypothetical protein JSV52_09905 [Candidatus Zixiibacteriota bacterium]|nr:MAG: hypothetical protein JSV52_09905 [candidate division Zixibacteria bacterium]
MSRYITLLLFVGIGVSGVWGQTDVDTVSAVPGITIKTEVDRAEMYVGDLITYTITIEYDSTYELIPPPLGANLGAFDVKDYQSDILTQLEDGRYQSKNIFVLSTFTTGDYVIPPIPVVFNMPDGTRKALLSEGVPIKVLSLLENAGDSVDIKPLKAQYEFKRDLTPYYIWGGLGLLVLILAAVLIILKLRQKKEISEPLDLRPAWEIAFEKLALLKQKNLPQEGQFKQFYIELTEIIRVYYESMYRLNVLDMTTEEFLAAFGKLELPEGLFERMEAFFEHADLVKFAKLIPEFERAEEDFEEVHTAIEDVRADWDRRLRPQLHDRRPGDDIMSADPAEIRDETEVKS